MKHLPLLISFAAFTMGGAAAQTAPPPVPPPVEKAPQPPPVPAPESTRPTSAPETQPTVPKPPKEEPAPRPESPLPPGVESPLPQLPSSESSPVKGIRLSQLDRVLEKLDSVSDLRIENSDISYKNGKAILKPRSGMLHFEADGMEVFAGSAEYTSDPGQLRFMGDVAIYREGVIYRGDNAAYNVDTRHLDASGMRTSIEPLFFKAARVNASGDRDLSVINLDVPEFTTHDSEDPGYRITADKVSLYPGDKVVFSKLKVFAGDTPVFYLPKLSQPLDEEFAYMVLPGYRSNLGAFLLNQYTTAVGDHTVAKYHFDLYSRRGTGAGVDLETRRFPRSSKFGKFKFYWLYDDDPMTSTNGDTRPRLDVDNSRYRVNLQHRVYLPSPKEDDFYLDIDLNKISDAFFYEDFFQNEFRNDPQPDNTLSLIKQHERGELSLWGRFHVNDFYETDSRLPEIALDRVIQPLWNSGFYLAGSSSFGILEEHMSDDTERALRAEIALIESGPDPASPANVARLDSLRASLINPGFNRSHTWNEVYYPLRWHDGAITLTPRMGAGFTSYYSIEGVEPLDDSRFLFSAGLDAAMKFSRVYDDVVNPRLGLDGLRHIVQPYVNWSYVSADSLGAGFGIDTLAPSTRPRPLEVSNWTALDSLRDWNLVRLGVSNRLQTKRDHTTFNWLTANTYMDAFIEDPEYDRDFSNLYQDISWRPVPWMKFDVGAQLPLSDRTGNFTEFNTRASFMPTDSMEFSIGHRTLNDHPVFDDSSLLDFHAYARLSEKWGVSIYERFEMDDSTLETQQYSVHRDLTSWIATLGTVIRDHRNEQEWGVLLSLTLKDFPAFRIPMDFDPRGGGQ